MAKGIYHGVDEFVPGIPARDLTDAEVNNLSEEVKQGLVEMGLYSFETVKAKAKKTKSEVKDA